MYEHVYRERVCGELPINNQISVRSCSVHIYAILNITPARDWRFTLATHDVFLKFKPQGLWTRNKSNWRKKYG